MTINKWIFLWQDWENKWKKKETFKNQLILLLGELNGIQEKKKKHLKQFYNVLRFAVKRHTPSHSGKIWMLELCCVG